MPTTHGGLGAHGVRDGPGRIGCPRPEALGDTEDDMFKSKTIIFAATIALVTWAAVSVPAQVGSHASGFAPPQIDTFDLMSRAGELPVETAPAI